MSFSVPELEDAEVIFDIGYNAPVSHPLVARHIVRAKKKGCKIICVDPRLTETGRIATIYLPIKGGTNMLFLNAMAHVMVTEDLVDHDFIEKHTTGFADYAKEVAQDKYAPEAVAAATHLDPDDIRRAARLFASSKHTMTLWGMGITQFSQGVECVIACSNLSLMTGNYGHYATGVGPVRGQNNVQGTCDMGVLPNQYPGYQDVTDDEIRHKFEKAWGVSLPSHVGLPLTYVPDKVLREPDPKKRIHAYYIIGEDPAQSDPDLPEIRRTLSAIDLVIVQDIFFNKTCEYADVIFPATAWGEHDESRRLPGTGHCQWRPGPRRLQTGAHDYPLSGNRPRIQRGDVHDLSVVGRRLQRIDVGRPGPQEPYAGIQILCLPCRKNRRPETGRTRCKSPIRRYSQPHGHRSKGGVNDV